MLKRFVRQVFYDTPLPAAIFFYICGAILGAVVTGIILSACKVCSNLVS